MSGEAHPSGAKTNGQDATPTGMAQTAAVTLTSWAASHPAGRPFFCFLMCGCRSNDVATALAIRRGPQLPPFPLLACGKRGLPTSRSLVNSPGELRD